MKWLANISISALTAVLVSVALYQYVPLSFFENFSQSSPRLGATITTINGSDSISGSRTTINTNFSNLNTSKFELSDWYATTSATQLLTLGTITAGTWNGSKVTVPFGGTGSTTLSSGQILLGNGTGNITTPTGFGISGQFLASNGSGVAPSWQTSSIDLTAHYLWTGLHEFLTASSTNVSIINTLFIGKTATTTIQGSTTGTSTIQGFVNIAGTNSTSTISGGFAVSGSATTSSLSISGTCDGCNRSIERISSGTSLDTTNGNSTSGTASCSAGNRVTGGGFTGPANAFFSNGSNYYSITNNYPDTTTSWNVTVTCHTAGTCVAGTLTVYAICTKL